MKIKQVVCDRFAGVSGVVDKPIVFADGLNVIIEDNGKGKSTLVDLIYCLFFVRSDANKKGTENNEFLIRCLPRSSDGSPDLDACIGGSVSFENGGKNYVLSKTWDFSGKGRTLCVLKVDGGAPVHGDDDVSRELEKIFNHNSGFCHEMLFSSQRDDQRILDRLLGAKENKEDINANVALDSIFNLKSAYTNTDGVSSDQIASYISRMLKGESQSKKNAFQGYGGKWDFEHDCPAEKGKANPGLIHDAYTKWKSLENDRDDLNDAYHTLRIKTDELEKKQARSVVLNEQLGKLQEYEQTLVKQEACDAKKAALDAEIERLTQDINDWNKQQKMCEDAVPLLEEWEDVVFFNSYKEIERLNNELRIVREQLNNMPDVRQDEIDLIRTLEAKIDRWKRDLKGLNVKAVFNKLGDKSSAEVRYIDGDKIEPVGEKKIDGSFRITVPDEFELSLMPEGVDALEVEKNINDCVKRCIETCRKYDLDYGADSLDTLVQMRSERADNVKQEDELSRELNVALNGRMLDDWEAEKKERSEPVRSEGDIRYHVRELCGKERIEDLRAYIDACQSKIKGYVTQHTDIDKLSATLGKKNEELAENKEVRKSLPEVPEEIAELNKDEIQKELDELQRTIEDIRNERSDAASKLGGRSETLEDLQQQIDEAKEEFDRINKKGRRWYELQQTFETCRKSLEGQPIDDLQTYFIENMNKLTSFTVNGINSADKSIDMISDGHKMEADIISNGNKDAAVLAFRLAVMRNSFTSGGMFIFLDDPFAHMDPDRLDAACALVQDFAKDNQVIFLACDPKYLSKLTGSNQVSLNLIK